MTKKASKQFPTIKNAAAVLKVSESLLKAAKQMGCKAFKARGSIDEKELLEFIEAHKEELTNSGQALRDQKLTEEIRKLRIRNDRDDKKLTLRSDEIARGQRFATWQREFLTQKLTKEYPSAVAGLDVAGAMAYGRRVVVAICESTQQMIKELESA